MSPTSSRDVGWRILGPSCLTGNITAIFAGNALTHKWTVWHGVVWAPHKVD